MAGKKKFPKYYYFFNNDKLTVNSRPMNATKQELQQQQQKTATQKGKTKEKRS